VDLDKDLDIDNREEVTKIFLLIFQLLTLTKDKINTKMVDQESQNKYLL
jgi:hypothetical protein